MDKRGCFYFPAGLWEQRSFYSGILLSYKILITWLLWRLRRFRPATEQVHLYHLKKGFYFYMAFDLKSKGNVNPHCNVRSRECRHVRHFHISCKTFSSTSRAFQHSAKDKEQTGCLSAAVERKIYQQHFSFICHGVTDEAWADTWKGEPGERHRLASKGGIFQLFCGSSDKPVPWFGPHSSLWAFLLFR